MIILLFAALEILKNEFLSKNRTYLWNMPTLDIKIKFFFKKCEAYMEIKERNFDVKWANVESVQRQREEFFKTDKIKKVKGKYILQEDVRFDKLSPAAEFVIGGSCNGKTEWCRLSWGLRSCTHWWYSASSSRPGPPFGRHRDQAGKRSIVQQKVACGLKFENYLVGKLFFC